MNLINRSPAVHFFLRLIAPVAGLMPRTVESLRYLLAYKTRRRYRHPRDAQDRIMADYFQAIADSDKMRLYADLADKYAVRSYVADRIGERYLTRLYGTWDTENDIDFDALPVPCVIKTTNGCGTNIIIRSRDEIKPDKMRAQLHRWLIYPYGKLTGQPHYSAIKPRIIAEEFLVQDPGADTLPYDYKFFCFDGEPRLILFYAGRRVNSHFTYNNVYDLDWNPIAGTANVPCQQEMPRPEALEDMVRCARELARGLRFARVDFYDIGPRPVFGEITLTPDITANFTPAFKAKMLGYYKN